MGFVGGARRPFRYRAPSDLVEDVFHSLDQSRPILYEAVAASVAPGRHIAGHGEHVPSLFQGRPGGNQGPALEVRLDDHHLEVNVYTADERFPSGRYDDGFNISVAELPKLRRLIAPPRKRT